MDVPELKKGTQAAVKLVPQLAQDGTVVTVVLIKERFAVDRTQQVSRLGDAEVRLADELWDDGPPDRVSIKYPSDLCLDKPSTDVVVVGSAVQAYRKPAKTLDVLVRVGALEQFLRVHGPRVWYKGLAGLALSPAEPFEETPLRWEYAWGGADLEGGKPLEEPRNPVGRGVAREPSTLVHQPGPQIEDPKEPITGHKARLTPAGVAAIGRHWEPRRRYTGTIDEAWKRERMPLMPVDFDPRFHQCAPPAMIAQRRLLGGELVQVHNACELGPLQFELPRLHFFVGAGRASALREFRAVLDTVLLEPNPRTFELTWRAQVPMPRKQRDLDFIQVHEKEVR